MRHYLKKVISSIADLITSKIDLLFTCITADSAIFYILITLGIVNLEQETRELAQNIVIICIMLLTIPLLYLKNKIDNKLINTLDLLKKIERKPYKIKNNLKLTDTYNKISLLSLSYLFWIKNDILPILNKEHSIKQYLPHSFMYLMCELHKEWANYPDLLKKSSTSEDTWKNYQMITKSNKYKFFLESRTSIFNELVNLDIMIVDGIAEGDLIWRDDGIGNRYRLTSFGEEFLKSKFIKETTQF